MKAGFGTSTQTPITGFGRQAAGNGHRDRLPRTGVAPHAVRIVARREEERHRDAAPQRLDQRAAGDGRGRAADEVVGGDRQPTRQVLDARAAERAIDPRQDGLRVEQSEARALANHPIDRTAALRHAFDLLRPHPGGQCRADDGAHAGPDDQRRLQAGLVERTCHAEVSPATAAATAQRQRERLVGLHSPASAPRLPDARRTGTAHAASGR